MYNYDPQNYSKSCFNHMTILGNKFSYTLVYLIKIFKFRSLPSCRRILAHESPYLWLTKCMVVKHGIWNTARFIENSIHVHGNLPNENPLRIIITVSWNIVIFFLIFIIHNHFLLLNLNSKPFIVHIYVKIFLYFVLKVSNFIIN